MSRIGKTPVLIPAGVECHLVANKFIAKGKLGQQDVVLSDKVTISIEDNKVNVMPKAQDKASRMIWGTMNRMINNLVMGVNQGFKSNLEINGVGYRAAVQANKLVLQLGYSHDVEFLIPSDISIVCEKPTSICVSGINKQRVGQIAANIRSFRPPEPYKGKGICYQNEKILRKEGKKK